MRLSLPNETKHPCFYLAVFLTLPPAISVVLSHKEAHQDPSLWVLERPGTSQHKLAEWDTEWVRACLT